MKMKLKHVEQYLSQLTFNFSKPKVHLEQYHTPPHLAATILHTIEANYNDIDGKIIADLGCGSGILTFGSILLGADFCFGLECDEDILDVFYENKNEFEISNCDAILFEINTNSLESSVFKNKVDTVIMNPPFGTRNPGIDLKFVDYATRIGKVVYSLHKTSTRESIVKKIAAFSNVEQVDVIAEMKYDLSQSYKFHKKVLHDIDVDLLRIVTL
uniref:Methyltransferase-like protein 5 n=2 Tax=Cacopsylla melanoneura TaxID=428564 RepID=A0A8D8S3V7_9HEMI